MKAEKKKNDKNTRSAEERVDFRTRTRARESGQNGES